MILRSWDHRSFRIIGSFAVTSHCLVLPYSLSLVPSVVLCSSVILSQPRYVYLHLYLYLYPYTTLHLVLILLLSCHLSCWSSSLSSLPYSTRLLFIGVSLLGSLVPSLLLFIRFTSCSGYAISNLHPSSIQLFIHLSSSSIILHSDIN